MKRHIIPLLLLGLCSTASAEPFDDLLNELGDIGAQGDSASFMSHVSWQDEPTRATYHWALVGRVRFVADRMGSFSIARDTPS